MSKEEATRLALELEAQQRAAFQALPATNPTPLTNQTRRRQLRELTARIAALLRRLAASGYVTSRGGPEVVLVQRYLFFAETMAAWESAIRTPRTPAGIGWMRRTPGGTTTTC